VNDIEESLDFLLGLLVRWKKAPVKFDLSKDNRLGVNLEIGPQKITASPACRVGKGEKVR
jgi:hypothetical protein